MKLKSLLLIVYLLMYGQSFAHSVQHFHPQEKPEDKSLFPAYCLIEIYNNSYEDFTVYGEFDDGARLRPFNVYSFEAPHYVSLFYYRYCHRDMFLTIVSFGGYTVYSDYTPANSTIVINNYLTQPKAELQIK